MNFYKLCTLVNDKELFVQWLKDQKLIPSYKYCKSHRRAYGYQSPTTGFPLGRFRCRGRSYADHSKCAADNTWFSEIKMDPAKALLLAYCYSLGMSYEQAKHESNIADIGTSSSTVATWYAHCREMNMLSLRSGLGSSGKVGGVGRVVEVVRSKKLPRTQTRSFTMIEGDYVLAMRDEVTCDLKVDFCSDVNVDDLLSLLEKHIASDSTLCINCYTDYGAKSAEEFSNACSSRNFHFLDPETEVDVKHIKQLKLMEAARKYGSADHFSEYLWRCMCTKLNRHPFEQLIEDIRTVYNKE